MSDLSDKFALICAEEHLNTLVTDYIIFGINKNNLDKGATVVYHTTTNAVLKKLYELLGKNIKQKITNDQSKI